MATALQLGRKGWESYLKTTLSPKDSNSISSAQDQIRQNLLAKARDAAQRLKEQFGASRVVLFGSIVHSAWFSKESDIDLAVAGLKGSEFLRAWALLEDLFPDRRVELIEFETVSGSLRSAIEKSGLEL